MSRTQDEYEEMWTRYLLQCAEEDNNIPPQPKNIKVFVYGSLMKGFSNFENFLADSICLCDDARTTKKYRMISLGGFPGIVKYSELQAPFLPSEIARFNSAFASVRGQVYEVDNITLRRLDSLEGNGTFYKRELIDVFTSSGKHKCWCYILPPYDAHSNFYPTCNLDEDGYFCWKFNKYVEYAKQVQKKREG